MTNSNKQGAIDQKLPMGTAAVLTTKIQGSPRLAVENNFTLAESHLEFLRNLAQRFSNFSRALKLRAGCCPRVCVCQGTGAGDQLESFPSLSRLACGPHLVRVRPRAREGLPG